MPVNDYSLAAKKCSPVPRERLELAIGAVYSCALDPRKLAKRRALPVARLLGELAALASLAAGPAACSASDALPGNTTAAGSPSGGLSGGGATASGAAGGGTATSGGQAQAGFSAGGAAGTNSGGSVAGGTAGGDPVEASFATLKDVIQSSCFGSLCHDLPENPLQLSVNAALYTTVTTHMTKTCGALVMPGRPQESALVRLLKGPCGKTDRMPYGKCFSDGDEGCVSPQKIAALEQWIENGAVP